MSDTKTFYKKQFMIGLSGFCLVMLLYFVYFFGAADACIRGNGTLYNDGVLFACFSEEVPECFVFDESEDYNPYGFVVLNGSNFSGDFFG